MQYGNAVVKFRHYNASRKIVSNSLSQEMLYVPERPDVKIARFRNCTHVRLES